MTPSLGIVELNVTVNNIKVLSVAKKSFYGAIISPATIKRM
jgi:hypothetical protein